MTIIKKTTHQIQSRKLTTADRVMLKALAQMPDSQIDYTEIPEIDWTQVKIVKKSTKKQIAFRVDSDILEFFQKKGKGYQTKMNEVLKSFVQHELA